MSKSWPDYKHVRAYSDARLAELQRLYDDGARFALGVNNTGFETLYYDATTPEKLLAACLFLVKNYKTHAQVLTLPEGEVPAIPPVALTEVEKFPPGAVKTFLTAAWNTYAKQVEHREQAYERRVWRDRVIADDDAVLAYGLIRDAYLSCDIANLVTLLDVSEGVRPEHDRVALIDTLYASGFTRETDEDAIPFYFCYVRELNYQEEIRIDFEIANRYHCAVYRPLNDAPDEGSLVREAKASHNKIHSYQTSTREHVVEFLAEEGVLVDPKDNPDRVPRLRCPCCGGVGVDSKPGNPSGDGKRKDLPRRHTQNLARCRECDTTMPSQAFVPAVHR